MRSRLSAALAAFALLAACAEPPQRAAFSASPEDMGLTQARAFALVQARVEPVAEAECARLNPGADCDFLIVVDDRRGMPPNAYQTLSPQGRPILAITASLIGTVANPDELALVMAHEASHHIAGHLAQLDATASLGAEAFGRIAREVEGVTEAEVRRAEMIGAQVAVQNYTREWELEADRLGARVAALAGFDPVRGAEFFLRIPDPGERRFGTHPSNGERIAAVGGAAAEMGL